MPASIIATPSVDPNDPRLTEPQADYTAIRFNLDGSPYIADRYLSLPEFVKRMMIQLAIAGHIDLAQRMASCCKAGHVGKRCSRHRYARAYRHHCGVRFCPTCCRASYLLHQWLKRRDHQILVQPHQAIEIKFRNPIPGRRHVNTLVWLNRLSGAFIKSLGENSLSVDALAISSTDCAIRVVFPAERSLTFSQLNSLLKASGSMDDLTVMTKRGTTHELFLWAFSGFHECAAMDPDQKASLMSDLRGHHITRVRGPLYRTLTPEELGALYAEDFRCPVCKDHDLETIPPTEWYVQPIEDIVAEYEHVEWAGSDTRPSYLIRKNPPTDISGDLYPIPPTASPVAPSPPPW